MTAPTLPGLPMLPTIPAIPGVVAKYRCGMCSTRWEAGYRAVRPIGPQVCPRCQSHYPIYWTNYWDLAPKFTEYRRRERKAA